MAFKTVQRLDADVTIAIGKVNKATGKPYPKQAEGYYLGSRTVKGNRGDSVIHFLETPKGNLGVWGTTDLNRKLGSAPAGAMVRITSTGTKPTPNGDMYTYKVEVDAENTIEVSSNDSSGYEASNHEEDGYDNGGYTNGADEDEAQSAALVAAERKAKLDAVLNKGKR